jgi:hypothetical protein
LLHSRSANISFFLQQEDPQRFWTAVFGSAIADASVAAKDNGVGSEAACF